MNQFPWEINPDLTEERVSQMAGFIAGVRNEVIELHDEELGDTRLALGMRAYECCRTRIIKESQIGSFTWLKILTPEGRFTFSIGNAPVRFTRNEPKYLPDRKLIVSENAQFQMDLFGSQPYAKTRWFFVFDTHYKSAADAVYLVGYSELGEIVCQWQIPLEDNVTLISDASGLVTQAVELEKPLVSVKRLEKETDNTPENEK